MASSSSPYSINSLFTLPVRTKTGHASRPQTPSPANYAFDPRAQSGPSAQAAANEVEDIMMEDASSVDDLQEDSDIEGTDGEDVEDDFESGADGSAEVKVEEASDAVDGNDPDEDAGAEEVDEVEVIRHIRLYMSGFGQRMSPPPLSAFSNRTTTGEKSEFEKVWGISVIEQGLRYARGEVDPWAREERRAMNINFYEELAKKHGNIWGVQGMKNAAAQSQAEEYYATKYLLPPAPPARKRARVDTMIVDIDEESSDEEDYEDFYDFDDGDAEEQAEQSEQDGGQTAESDMDDEDSDDEVDTTTLRRWIPEGIVDPICDIDDYVLRYPDVFLPPTLAHLPLATDPNLIIIETISDKKSLLLLEEHYWQFQKVLYGVKDGVDPRDLAAWAIDRCVIMSQLNGYFIVDGRSRRLPPGKIWIGDCTQKGVHQLYEFVPKDGGRSGMMWADFLDRDRRREEVKDAVRASSRTLEEMMEAAGDAPPSADVYL